MKFEFTVAEADAGRRLDRYLAAHLAPQLGGLPASRIQRLLRKGDVKVNGKRGRAGDLLRPGDQVVAHHSVPAYADTRDGTRAEGQSGTRARGQSGTRGRPPGGAIAAEGQSGAPRAGASADRGAPRAGASANRGAPRADASADRGAYTGPGIPVLFEGDGLLVVNKPAEVSCDHGEGGGPGLLQWAEEKYASQVAVGDMRPATPHRLDIGTSGATCITLTAAAAESFRKGLEEGRVRKLYWVLVWGRPLEEEFDLRIPLRRLPHTPRNRPKVVAAPSADEGQPAHTRFSWIAAGPEASLLEAEPLSGRTHQIRAHCLAHGLPVVGDPRYGDPKRDRAVGLDAWLHRQCLHARNLGLDDPKRGFSVDAALTRDFERTLRSLGVPLHS